MLHSSAERVSSLCLGGAFINCPPGLATPSGRGVDGCCAVGTAERLSMGGRVKGQQERDKEGEGAEDKQA